MRLLLAAALMAACATASAAVPYATSPNLDALGHSREYPQALSHWQIIAERQADLAAPALQNTVISSRFHGVDSAFDMAFHDFFITALHQRGVAIDDRSGSSVELASYPLRFNSRRRVDYHSGWSSRYAPRNELGLTVRVFDGSKLLYSGSTTYYTPDADELNYRSLRGPSRDGGVVLKVTGK